MKLSNAMTHFNFCSPLRPSLRIKSPFMSAYRWGILEFLSRQATLSAEQSRHVFRSGGYERSATLF